MTFRVLIAEHERPFATDVQAVLSREGHEVRVAANAPDVLTTFASLRPGLVLLNDSLPGGDSLSLLAHMTACDANVRVIMLAERIDVEAAVKAMKAGAADYLAKPKDLDHLCRTIGRVARVDATAGRRALCSSHEPVRDGIETMLGHSVAMRALKARLSRVISAERGLSDNNPAAVLILGETGTGKELVARALHFANVRAAQPFVEINCASIPPSLIEAELFGYERGAFTDAKERKSGLAEAAHGGTLFLDEIGELDLAIQGKLLKLLEEKRVRRIGAIREQHVDVRVMAATNRNLETMVAQGSFRADLYYRLRIIQIDVPTLREREQDILTLAQQFLAVQAKRYGRPQLRLSADAEQCLLRHHWPGNVRELKNAVEQAVLFSDGVEVTAAQFPFCGRSAEARPRPSTTTPTPTISPYHLETIEREHVLQALSHTAWNVTRAAKLLGLSRDTLRYRIEKHRLRAMQ